MGFTFNCIRKISHQKKEYFKQNKIYIDQTKDIFQKQATGGAL